MPQPRCTVTLYNELHGISSAVNRIIQDNDGMLWLGTNNGLVRYDGYNFIPFRTKLGDGSGMTTDRISSLYLSSVRGLWCLSGGRAYLFDFDTYRFLDVMAETEKALGGGKIAVNKVRPLSNGTTWLICRGGFCYRIDDRRPTSHATVKISDIDDNCLITSDSEGRSWLLAAKKTYVVKGRRIITFNAHYKALARSGGICWLLNDQGDLCFFNSHSERIERYRRVTPPESIIKIIGMTRNRLALITTLHLCVLDISQGELNCDAMSMATKQIREDIDGNLWVMTATGELLVFKNGFLSRRVDIKNIDPAKWIEDSSGTMWIICKDGRIFYIPHGGDNLSEYPCEASFLQHGMNFVSDNSDNIWFRNSNGLIGLRFSLPCYEFLAQEREEQVRAVLTDNRRCYWVAGKDNKTLSLYDSLNRRTGYLLPNGALSRRWASFGSPVYSMLQDSKGYIWLGSKPDGLYRLKETGDGRFGIVLFDHLLNNNEVVDMKEDNLGRLWVATYRGGANCIIAPDSDTPRVINRDNGLRGYPRLDDRTTSICVTSGDVIIIGTHDGLIIGDIGGDPRQTVFRRHKRDNSRSGSLSSMDVMNVFENGDHRIFVSTENRNIDLITSKNLLADSLHFAHTSDDYGFGASYSIIENNGELWTTNLGKLSRLFVGRDGTIRTEAYIADDALNFSECRPARLPDGRWMYGLTNGAIIVDFNKISRYISFPPLYITGVTIGDGATDYAVNARDTIVMSPGNSDISVAFSSLSYTKQQSLNYAFRLDDGAWTYLGSGHLVHLSNLKPGSYTLAIRATNGEGRWMSKPRIITVIVKPTFTQSTIGHITLLLVILLAVGTIYWNILYIRRIKRRHRDLLEQCWQLMRERKHDDKEQLGGGHEPARRHQEGKKDQEKRVRLEAANEAFAKRLMIYIDEEIGNPDITVEDIANATATSVSGLNRKTRELFGITPAKFLQKTRIEKSKDLLLTDMTVSEVADICGFADSKYFSRCFKKDTGLTPSAYKSDTSTGSF